MSQNKPTTSLFQAMHLGLTTTGKKVIWYRARRVLKVFPTHKYSQDDFCQFWGIGSEEEDFR